ncbi:hypothetical protein OB2597_14214 [Pseudooceanicola batsensis HTCC2597]|uniref:Uncharacterized protein n=1 Tax=Pseudooceanicola batsensis (strain ATCC BAA-863 / DSM 15984 / KCTC 12145 / HTCC2597) TaxID=252305 RepID=A3U3Y3_PSEBH|nr:hypothetical protein OB2597_14214 [Pseudooceanicola batsensis HTCC2597]
MRGTGNHRAAGAGLLFLAAMSGAAGWSLGAFGPDPRGPPGPAGATTGGGAPLPAP